MELLEENQSLKNALYHLLMAVSKSNDEELFNHDDSEYSVAYNLMEKLGEL